MNHDKEHLLNNVLIIDRTGVVAKSIETAMTRNGFNVDIISSGHEALKRVRTDDYRIVISDTDLSGMDTAELLSRIGKEIPDLPVIMTAEAGSVKGAVDAMQAGAVDYLLKPCSPDTLVLSIKKALNRRDASPGHKGGRKQPGSTRKIVTRDQEVVELLKITKNIARSRATVLILGESGTGKELLAAYIHQNSLARENPFVALNCAALPEHLAESELFGHEKGSFTGAVSRKIGKFELARGGTILLDEISEMVPPLQAKLLRVLQENEIDRVGGSQPVKIDTRVIAISNIDLKKAVEEGKFRKDLFYRINVIPLTLPPLRKRRDDILLLAEHFIRKYCRENQREAKALSEKACRKLLDYSWPGNIRELENIIERAVVISSGKMIPSRLITLESDGPATANTVQLHPGMSVKEMEQELISQTLRKVNDNRTHAAEMLGISIRTLRNKLKEYREKNAA